MARLTQRRKRLRDHTTMFPRHLIVFSLIAGSCPVALALETLIHLLTFPH
jgi:hypothetical protein